MVCPSGVSVASWQRWPTLTRTLTLYRGRFFVCLLIKELLYRSSHDKNSTCLSTQTMPQPLAAEPLYTADEGQTASEKGHQSDL